MMFQYVPGRQAMHQLRGEVNRLFSDVLENLGSPWLTGSRGQPALCAWEEPDGFQVELEVPGVKQEQLEISVVGNELTVKLERPATEGTATYHRRERPAGNFSRTLRLPAVVDAAGVNATLRDGVLSIRLPKAESAKARKIQVNSVA